MAHAHRRLGAGRSVRRSAGRRSVSMVASRTSLRGRSTAARGSSIRSSTRRERPCSVPGWCGAMSAAFSHSASSVRASSCWRSRATPGIRSPDTSMSRRTLRSSWSPHRVRRWRVALAIAPASSGPSSSTAATVERVAAAAIAGHRLRRNRGITLRRDRRERHGPPGVADGQGRRSS